MIFTVYRPDGRKVRQPVGYGSGLCHKATEPYEAKEVPGTVIKQATAEALEPAAIQTAEEAEKIRQG